MSANGNDTQVQEPRFPVTFGDIGWMVLATLSFIFILAGIWIILRGFGADLETFFAGRNFVFVAAVLQSAFIVACIYYIPMRRRGLDWRGIGFRPISRRWLVAAGLIAIAGIPTVAAVTAGFQAALDRPFGNPQIGMIAPNGFTWLGALSMFIAVAILAPFAEELAFRGILYKFLRKYWPTLPSALVSATAFGFMHGFVDVVPGTLLLGFVMALAYEKSGSLWVPVAIHTVYNGLSVILLFLLLAFGVDMTGPTET